MDQDEKFKSEVDEKHERKSEIDKELEKIKTSFNIEYAKWDSRKQNESSSKHGNQSTDGDSSLTSRSSSSKKGWPKVNRMETKSELPGHTVYGFTNEILFLKNLLKQKEPEEFKTLAIVGKCGVGKTTLCQVVFNDEEMKRAYLPRIWVSMYREGTKEDKDPKIAVVKRILRSLGVEDETFEHIKTEAEEENRSKTEAGQREEETVKEKELSQLLYALHLNLFGKKYLIVLDDVWEEDEWNQRLDDENKQQEKSHLSRGFPFGGRVIVTTRDERLAKKIVREEENIQRLFPRSDAETVRKIYMEHAVVAEKVNPRYPGRFRQELMDKSRGIPLVARMLAQSVPVRMDETAGEDVERKESF